MSSKSHIRSALIVLLVIKTFICNAQMVHTPRDIHIVCQKENEFIGRPLKVLLKELKPPIEMVFAEGGWAERTPQFTFFFMSKQRYDCCRSQGNLPLRLRVYVNDFLNGLLRAEVRSSV